VSDVRIERVARKGSGKGGGQSSVTTPHQPVEYPNTLRSRATVRILEVLSEGVVYGLHGGDSGSIWQSVFVDDTPFGDAAGNLNYNLYSGEFRYGLPSQDWVPGFPIAEAEFAVGIVCTPSVPVVRACNTPISAVRYKVRIPALYTQESDGDVVGASVSYAFDVQINGGLWTNFVTERIYGKTMSPYERAVRVQLPPDALIMGSTVNIRIIRLDPTPDPHTANTIAWSSYTEIQDGQLAYDDTCVIAMTIDAEQFQNVPQRSYLLDGIQLQTPTNYNGRTHGYSGDWDGSFTSQWSNNPAWVLYNLLTNPRWGLGSQLDPAAVDKWSFYTCAVHNDGSVPDPATGGVELRFTCNCVINTRQDAYVVLQAIASNMLAQIYYSSGTIFLVQDRYMATPMRLFGPADIEGGLFDYSSADVRSRFTAAAITWNDPGDSYNPAVELVQDPALVAAQGYRETQQTYFGCTSRGQAIRYGRWLIYTSQYEVETVTFRVGLENADLRPGDYISLNDPARAGARLAGRLLQDDGASTVTLDAVDDAMRATPTAWQIYVTLGTAADPHNRPRIMVLQVVSVADSQVTVSGKTEPLPPGSMWMATSSAVLPTPWRVAAIVDRGAGSYEITATEYHNEKFAYVEQGVLIPPPSFSLVPTGPLAPPTNLAYREYIYLDGSGVPQFGVVVSWSASVDARVTRYQLELSSDQGEYRIYRQIAGVSQDVPAMRQGAWNAAITGFDNIGRKAPVATLSFTPLGLSALPLAPDALYITPQGPLTTLSWVPTGEIDVVFYWLKWAPQTDGTAIWENATTSIARVNRDTTQITTPTRAGTFMLKSIDSLGQESATWVSAILSPQISERVAVIDKEEQPAWSGNPGSHWTVNSGELWLAPPSAPEAVPPGVFPGERGTTINATPTRTDVYTFASGAIGGFTIGVSPIGGIGNPYDLGLLTANVSLVGIVDGYGRFASAVMARWVPLAAAKPLAMGKSAQWDAHIEYQVSQDGVAFGPWTPLKSTLVTGRLFAFRLVGVLYDLATTMRISRAAVILEVPLRSLRGNDQALDGTGHLSVVYPNGGFVSTPNVQITARQSLAPGGNIVITASTATGFTVEHRNAAGAATAGGSIDYYVQGFGGHL
jgi:predicted phage tail protein